jgi:CRISPR-associated endonuclease Cas2
VQTFVVIYDIFDKKRLYKVRKIVYSYATSGQKSALEVHLDKNGMQSLISELVNVIKDDDKVNIIKVSKPILLGRGDTIEYQNGIVII